MSPPARIKFSKNRQASVAERPWRVHGAWISGAAVGPPEITNSTSASDWLGIATARSSVFSRLAVFEPRDRLRGVMTLRPPRMAARAGCGHDCPPSSVISCWPGADRRENQAKQTNGKYSASGRTVISSDGKTMTTQSKRHGRQWSAHDADGGLREAVANSEFSASLP
jgi:hypothetical protein